MSCVVFPAGHVLMVEVRWGTQQMSSGKVKLMKVGHESGGKTVLTRVVSEELGNTSLIFG